MTNCYATRMAVELVMLVLFEIRKIFRVEMVNSFKFSVQLKVVSSDIHCRSCKITLSCWE